MSCFPDILLASRSQNLPNPHKMGAMFSINLRSSFFTNQKQLPADKLRQSSQGKSVSFSLDNKRYRSWMDKQQSLLSSRAPSKSFYKVKNSIPEKAIEQNGHNHQNVNGRLSHIIEVEAIQNFNSLKKSTLQTLHLSQKVLQITKTQSLQIKEDLNRLDATITADFTQFSTSFSQACLLLLKQFRQQRRLIKGQNKAISQQVTFLVDQISTNTSFGKEIEGRLDKVIDKFL